MTAPPEVIYLIRPAEKPFKPHLSGVDYEGGPNEHSLLPRGWQRSGALAALFHPDSGPLRPGLRTPPRLGAPSRGGPPGGGAPAKDAGPPVVPARSGPERAAGSADRVAVRPGARTAAGRQPG